MFSIVEKQFIIKIFIYFKSTYKQFHFKRHDEMFLLHYLEFISNIGLEFYNLPTSKHLLHC